ncbi:response regulator [Nodosilinea sp. LEGE 07298]|uniref:response regulator n=1 Tax=Nodosilinea sp. LEGE 07298 TaxID=2777970 RepID=UPI0018825417|nr:response regulator [Nodosilinea sp. LEGE 07298]MBE9109334.1 response regulator [Nodosilinea sp. LEGE 07298]
MDAPQKLAFVVQSNRLQGLMWQALLKSQKLAVILEPAKGDLADCMSQIASAGLTLPDVIVLDAEAAELNPYEFCRWCRAAFPKMQIFLTRCRQLHVSDTERRWAKQQGATDFLSGFDRDTLMTSATENIKCILTRLDYPFLNEKALLTVLLNIRRQLGTTQSASPALAIRPDTVKGKSTTPGLSLAGAKPPVEEPVSPEQPTPDPLNDVAWVTSGLRALSNGKARKAAKDSFTPSPPAVESNALPKRALDEKLADGTTVRRYRGVVY